MSRPARNAVPASHRERLKLEQNRAAPLRDIYPQLAELRVEFEFQDGTPRAPSSQSFSYFPAARGFFRYACPCHSCSGEFDLTGFVAEAAGKAGRTSRSRSTSVPCPGQRAPERRNCPIVAQVGISAILHKE